MKVKIKKNVLVTGASSGIGYATVEKLAKRGFNVYALARRKEKLNKLSEITNCKILCMDLLDTKKIESLKNIKIDILVNNAGLGRGFDKIFKTKSSDIDVTIDTNVKALLHLLRVILPGMVKRKKGHIINIGSIAGLYPLSSSVYGGSKGALHLINQNLRIELLGTGIKATEINPGRVATEFFDVAFDNEKDKVKMKTGFKLLTSNDIADTILYIIETPDHVNISMVEITPTEQVPGGVYIKRNS